MATLMSIPRIRLVEIAVQQHFLEGIIIGVILNISLILRMVRLLFFMLHGKGTMRL